MYNKHQNWSEEEINELVELAEDMYETNSYIQFCKVAKDLTDPNISAIRLETIFFLCVQLCKMYIEAGEHFAVKYFIQQIQWNLGIALEKQNNVQ